MHFIYKSGACLSPALIHPNIWSYRAPTASDTRRVDACAQMPFADSEFETVILFGNNLGICGTPSKVSRMLRELHRITTPNGLILGTTLMLTLSDPIDRVYIQRNIAAGRPAGQVRLRLGLDDKVGPWFNLLLFTPTGLDANMPGNADGSWQRFFLKPRLKTGMRLCSKRFKRIRHRRPDRCFYARVTLRLPRTEPHRAAPHPVVQPGCEIPPSHP